MTLTDRLERLFFVGEAVSSGCFARQMLALRRAGYRVIPPGALARALEERPAGGRDRLAGLIFDDGLRGQLLHATPVLERLDLPATFFLVAGAASSVRGGA